MTEDKAHPTLLGLLADGKLHSGSALAAEFGISRAAVWKRIKKLQELGVEIQKVQSHGYRLAEPLELLDAGQISREVAARLPHPAPRIDVAQEVGSTNLVLLEGARAGCLTGMTVLFAEQQTHGRGRRGRTWVSPFGKNIYMSVLWRTDRGLQALEGLSLAIGVAVATALQHSLALPIRLKWPNDILLNDAKLGGILIEVDGDLSGSLSVVIGIGLNVGMPSARMNGVDQAWADLAKLAAVPVSRNAVAVDLVVALISALADFEQYGFGPFRDAWSRLDAFAGRDVTITGLSEPINGKAHGVDDAGALLLEQDGKLRSIVAGDVSLRVTRDT